MIKAVLNRALQPLGLKLVDAYRERLLYQHDYGEGGYETYREVQIAANKRKKDRIWADDQTLETIAKDIEKRGLKNGLCHGARTGYEVEWFRKRLGGEILGTDISDTAADIPNMVVQDYHEQRVEWLNAWDFIYTNSLDQAFDPRKALDAWADQISKQGCIYIEHTTYHSAAGASETDPFGAHPLVVPYLIFKWGKGKYCLSDILELDEVPHKGHVWIFVVSRTTAVGDRKG